MFSHNFIDIDIKSHGISSYQNLNIETEDQISRDQLSGLQSLELYSKISM